MRSGRTGQEAREDRRAATPAGRGAEGRGRVLHNLGATGEAAVYSGAGRQLRRI